MKFSVSALNLKKVASLLGDVVPSKSMSQESGGILMEVSENRAIFSAVGTDTIVKASVPPLSVSEPGQAVVNSGMFSGVVNSFSPADEGGVGTEYVDIQATPTKGCLVIKAKTSYGKTGKVVKHKRTIPLLNFELFPTIPELKDLEQFTIPGILFREAIERTSYAVSSDTNSGPQRGIYLSAADGKLKAAATDSVKLSEYIASVDESVSFDAVVPVKFATKAAKSIDIHSDVVVRVSENIFWVSSPGVLVGGVIHSDSFPNYSDFLTPPEKEAIVDKAVLIDNIRNVNFGHLDDDRVTLDFSDKVLCVKTELAVNDGVEVSFTGEFSVSFNMHLLIASLKVVPGTRVHVGFSGSEDPVFFSCDKGFLSEGVKFKSVLMPLNG